MAPPDSSSTASSLKASPPPSSPRLVHSLRTQGGSLTWLEGRGWLSSVADTGPGKAEGAGGSSGTLEKGPCQDGPCIKGAPGHTVHP